MNNNNSGYGNGGNGSVDWSSNVNMTRPYATSENMTSANGLLTVPSNGGAGTRGGSFNIPSPTLHPTNSMISPTLMSSPNIAGNNVISQVLGLTNSQQVTPSLQPTMSQGQGFSLASSNSNSLKILPPPPTGYENQYSQPLQNNNTATASDLSRVLGGATNSNSLNILPSLPSAGANSTFKVAEQENKQPPSGSVDHSKSTAASTSNMNVDKNNVKVTENDIINITSSREEGIGRTDSQEDA